MLKLSKFLSNERKHFDCLNADARGLLTSFVFAEVSFPLVTVFANAFLWRQSENILHLVLYNSANFVFIPIAFLLTAKLLRKHRMVRIYYYAMLAIGFIPVLLTFIGQSTVFTILMFGCVYGLFNGLYWASRSFFTLKVTNNSNRNFFVSLEMVLASIVGLIMPFVFGWTIVLGEKTGLYDPNSAYKLITLIVFLVLLFSSRLVSRLNVSNPKVGNYLLRKPGDKWRNMRRLMFFKGVLMGINAFVPAILVFYFLGREGVLGTIQSISTVIGVFILYQIGKKSRPEHRFKLLIFAVIILIAASFQLSVNFNHWGVIVFMLLSTVSMPILNNSLNTIFYTGVEETVDDETSDFKHITDAEIFINLGRLSGIAMFLTLYYSISPEFGLRFILLILAIAQISMIYFARRVIVSPK